MPHGLFATRADLLMDVAIVLLTLLPLALLRAVQLARQRRFSAHRNLQVATLIAVLAIVLLLELDIRHSGGSAAFLARSPQHAALLRPLLRAHIAVATLTFLAWVALARASWRRFGRALPGPFSARHRSLGYLVFAGACALSLSGAAMYALLFVL